MKNTLRRTSAAMALGVVALVGTPTLALAADGDYPASSPSASVAGVKAGSSDVADAAAGTGSSGSALPRTGTDVAVWLVAGAGLVTAGTVLVSASRRRGVRA